MQRLLASGSPSAPTYVDDVFSAYTYTGNGSTQTITNGIDLSGKGGLVWFKSRTPSAYGHYLFDTLRGNNKSIRTESTGAETTTATPITFNSNGMSLGNVAGWNESATSFASWTFRKAAKFFDVVTVSHTTGTGTDVSFSSLSTVGMVISKRTDSTSNWVVWHRSTGNGNLLKLEATDASAANASAHSVSGTTVTLSSSLATGTYVVYAFAHDTATDGLIQCGSFTTDGSGNATVSLGWEPQYVLYKPNAVSDWGVVDASRAMPVTAGSAARLYPNASAAEGVGNSCMPNATGFTTALIASTTYIYMAIRRPNKPPTTGTQVYNAIARTGTGAAATVTGVGFAPDLMIPRRTGVNTSSSYFFDRLRGPLVALSANTTDAETSFASSVTSYDMDGVSVGTSSTANPALPLINWFFKRAPGVFDEVCYTSTTEAAAVTHGLTVAPEIVLIKSRSAGSWYAIHYGIDGYNPLTNVAFSTGLAPTYTPTSSNFKDINASASQSRVAYLFATKAGISKVFSYTGNGSSQTINCGFSAGARFILIKRTDSTGDWYVWDTVRGVVAGNDPHLSLNTTAAEVTTNDSIDPDNSGFIVNQLAATNINVTSATYIGLALS